MRILAWDYFLAKGSPHPAMGMSLFLLNPSLWLHIEELHKWLFSDEIYALSLLSKQRKKHLNNCCPNSDNISPCISSEHRVCCAGKQVTGQCSYPLALTPTLAHWRKGMLPSPVHKSWIKWLQKDFNQLSCTDMQEINWNCFPATASWSQVLLSAFCQMRHATGRSFQMPHLRDGFASSHPFCLGVRRHSKCFSVQRLAWKPTFSEPGYFPGPQISMPTSMNSSFIPLWPQLRPLHGLLRWASGVFQSFLPRLAFLKLDLNLVLGDECRG